MQPERKPVRFEAAWGNEGYIPYDQRPPAPSLPRRYVNEKAAEADLERLLSPYCHLYDQVKLHEPGYPPQYIDYLAVFKDADAQSSLKFFGIEVKSGFDDVKGACAVVRQAMRYRKARINDRRDALQRFCNDQMSPIFLWPQFQWAVEGDWFDRHPNPTLERSTYFARCDGEARALRLFAQHFNIGHIECKPWWGPKSQQWIHGIVLMNGQQQVWTSRYIDQISDGFGGGLNLAADSKRGLRYIE